MGGHTFKVFAYELRRNLFRRRYLFTTFGIPLLAVALLMGYQFISSRTSSGDEDSGSAPSLSGQLDFSNIGQAGYVDLSGMFSNPGELASNLTRYPDEAAAQEALSAGNISVYYVIAPDYLETGDVTVVQPRLNIATIGDMPIYRLLLNQLSEGVDPQVFQRLLNPSNIQATNLTLVNPQDAQNEDGSFLLVYVLAILLMFSSFTTSGYLMQSVIEEKETRLIEILISTVRPTQLLAGKILAMGIVGLVQVTAWIGGVYLLAQVASGGTANQTVGILATIANLQIPVNMLPLLLVYFILAYFLFAGLFSIVGALSNSLREGPQYAVLFTLPAALPLYFTSLFATTPDGVIPTVLSIFPLTAPIAMTARLVIANVPTWQLALSLSLLTLTAIGVMWLAGRAFRVQLLLAGQMPKLKDLPRLLRG
jgi:ABC-2 type transport system permease protein